MTGSIRILMMTATILLAVGYASCGGDSPLIVRSEPEDPIPAVLAFQEPIEYRLPCRFYGITASDMDGDGDKDIVVNSGACDMAIMANNGDGTFEPADVHDLPTFVSPGVHAADLDGDGDNDLVTAHYDGTIHLHLNNSDATFQYPVFIEDPLLMVESHNSADLLFVEDMDNDGDADIVAGCEAPSGIAVLLNNGDATFQPPVFSPQLIFRNAELEDLDKDGNLDILGTLYPGSFVTILGNGDGTFQEGVVHHFLLWEIMGFELYFAVPSDLDGDGDVDVVAGLSENSLHSLIKTGDVTFVRTSSCETPERSRYGKAADMDGDGDDDVVTASYTAGCVTIYQNDGNAVFGKNVHVDTGEETNRFVVSDLDGDGDLDLAVSRYDRVLIILNESGAAE